MSSKTLILVIGCGRSGTSAVAGSLAQMGVSLGDNLIPPAFDNPKGFFESRAVVALHDELLDECGGSWDHPFGSGSIDVEMALSKIRAIVCDLPGPVCAVKDPRASLFVHLWDTACEAEGVRLCILEVQRDREAVAASLMKREGWSTGRANSLVDEYIGQITYARNVHLGEWSTIEFPGDLLRESVWQKILRDFSLDLELDMDAVRDFVDHRLIHHGPSPWTVLIPSRSDKKILDCVASLVDTHPATMLDQIVVISDGLSPLTRHRLSGVRWVEGMKPFVFARAINMGAKTADADSDLIILGDDVRFVTSLALDKLAAASHGVAAVAPEVSGICGQPAQRTGSLEAQANWLAFICIYIPRHAWDAVGPLDERFIGYGYDDVDWCRRARRHGQLRINHNINVSHLDESSYRGRNDWIPLYQRNRRIFEEKWRNMQSAGVA